MQQNTQPSVYCCDIGAAMTMSTYLPSIAQQTAGVPGSPGAATTLHGMASVRKCMTARLTVLGVILIVGVARLFAAGAEKVPAESRTSGEYRRQLLDYSAGFIATPT